MTDRTNVHRFVTFRQEVRATAPEVGDLQYLLREWGLTDATQEALWVIAIDNMTTLKTVTEVAVGGFHDVIVHIPAVLAAVVGAHTDRFYIAHNHPSGPVTPTEEDIALTAHVLSAANVAGLSLEDHVITGPEGWYSFFEHGLLERADTLGIKAALKQRGRRGAR